MDPQLEKWISWFGDINAPATSRDAGITKEIKDLCVIRHVFNTVADIVRENADIQRRSIFYDVWGYSYAHAVLSGIRRHVKIDKRSKPDSKSLAQLLHEIAERHTNPTKELKPVLTRSYYVGLFEQPYESKQKELLDQMRQVGDEEFTDDFAGSIGTYVDPKIVQNDLEDLRSTAAQCEEFVDRRVAHLDRRPPAVIPTFAAIDASIEVLDRLASKYERLLTGSSPETALPVLDPEWMDIFRVPWIG